MNFSEFKRKLGAEPRSTDPELQRARLSAPEFEEAAAEAEQFEAKLDRATSIPLPDGLLADIIAIGRTTPEPDRRKAWLPMALAATVLLAVGAAGLTWKMNPSWDSVDEYLADHFSHDGMKVVAMADGSVAGNVQEMLAGFGVQANPELADIIGVIKYCPTPDGKGVHMVLNTENGPVTLIYMPDTEVTDKQLLAFGDVAAILVDLPNGSAAIIGSGNQDILNLHAVVHDSIVPATGSS